MLLCLLLRTFRFRYKNSERYLSNIVGYTSFNEYDLCLRGQDYETLDERSFIVYNTNGDLISYTFDFL